jgi:hypothetical protein
MSKSYRRMTEKKLQEIINTETDPTIIIEAANALAKYLPKPKQARRRRGTPVAPIKTEDQTLEEMVAALEKNRRGLPLTEDEKQMVAAVEKKR